MAHREMRKSRVLMVAAGLSFLLLALWVRIGWLQLGMHAHYLERANQSQTEHRKLLARRGEIFDRNGRLLARDLQTASVWLIARDLNDRNAAATALAKATGVDVRRLRRAIAGRRGFLYVVRHVSPEIGQKVRNLHLAGVQVDDEVRRDYPLGDAAVELLGRTNVDNFGVEGVELQYDESLRGRPGWTTLFLDGRGGRHALPRGQRREPTDGRSLTLTIDAELQSIVEAHLTRAVDTLKAQRGFAVFMNPRTGEILASACYPHLPPGQSKNWIVTDVYEPGSTFKAVTAGAILEERLARPAQVISASATGRLQLVPGKPFEDTHAHASYTFASAVQHSSNIVFGKLGLQLGPDRLYRYATALGFGALSGIPFPGEVPGRLRSTASWSQRSCPTIAIGYEVMVTPLQLALAYSAIANGGVLMEPMLIREVRDIDGRVVRRFEPQAAHHVFSEATCATLRTMLTAVVDSGTAMTARVPGFSIAGKTGTAKKYDAAIGSYARRYIGSFAGMAPADDPRIVGVVVIDDPSAGSYYGGLVAAPVFREVVMDLRRLTHGPLDPTTAPVAARPPVVAAITAPDLRLLPPREAEKRLAEYGLHARFEGAGARVLSQSPAAGEPVERGAAVVAFLAPPADSAGRVLPNLVGLTVREAQRRLSLRQVSARFTGSGIVVRQEPAPGSPLPLRTPCRLVCEPARPAAAANGGPSTVIGALVLPLPSHAVPMEP